jgi:hypothetical protein
MIWGGCLELGFSQNELVCFVDQCLNESQRVRNLHIKNLDKRMNFLIPLRCKNRK